MKSRSLISLVCLALLSVWVPAAQALTPVPVGTGFQCPNDVDNVPAVGVHVPWVDPSTKGPEDFDWNNDGFPNHRDSTLANPLPLDPNVVCIRVGVSDGYAQMPDGTQHYLFGFMNLTGVPEDELVDHRFEATLPAPLIDVKEGQQLFLTLTNLSLLVRPDLADPHTLHFHGYPHAMAIFDGVPEMSVGIPGSSSFTYFYALNDAGTYPYHCHVEPTEHLEMGMVGTIIVRPAQDGAVGFPGTYAYNDGGLAPDTRYDVSADLHIHDIDPLMHHNLETVQEGSNAWSEYSSTYSTFNGRGYPDTLLADANFSNQGSVYKADYNSQPRGALIDANVGDKILLRVVSLAYQTHTITVPGIPMHVVGEDARLLRGSTGVDMSYRKNVYSLAGGKTADIILDTAGLTAGETYFVYGRELNTQSSLSREDREAGIGAENRNGMITEIHIH